MKLILIFTLIIIQHIYNWIYRILEKKADFENLFWIANEKTIFLMISMLIYGVINIYLIFFIIK